MATAAVRYIRDHFVACATSNERHFAMNLPNQDTDPDASPSIAENRKRRAIESARAIGNLDAVARSFGVSADELFVWVKQAVENEDAGRQGGASDAPAPGGRAREDHGAIAARKTVLIRNLGIGAWLLIPSLLFSLWNAFSLGRPSGLAAVMPWLTETYWFFYALCLVTCLAFRKVWPDLAEVVSAIPLLLTALGFVAAVLAHITG